MDVEAWAKLSLIEKGLGNYPQAENCARRALALNPKLAYGHYALGQALHSQMQRVAAIASYRAATALMPDLADAHYLLGLALHEQGEIADATASLRQALRCRPDFPEALAELGAVCLDVGEVEAGLDKLQHAVRLQPTHLAALGNISHALRLLGQNQEALDNFRHALLLAPHNVDLMAGLAGLLEKIGQPQEAQSLVDKALQLDPMHVTSHLVAARMERGTHSLQAAVDRLQSLLQPTLPVDLSAEIMLELGQIHDQMGDASRAYPLILEGKRRKAMATLNGDGNSGAYLARLARMRQLATPALAEMLRGQAQQMALSDAEQVETRTPVFLIGFPRSGTTLMEQILDSHPRIQAMEEKSTVAHMVNRALDMLDERQGSLTDLRDPQLTELRQLYFSEVSRHISRSGQHSARQDAPEHGRGSANCQALSGRPIHPRNSSPFRCRPKLPPATFCNQCRYGKFLHAGGYGAFVCTGDERMAALRESTPAKLPPDPL
ncbi:MAG: tetratricopeptide repeat protein [Rhodoferax sp.]|nr:tetratricopeptide repeat protein [Rhodoferax sp.]